MKANKRYDKIYHKNIVIQGLLLCFFFHLLNKKIHLLRNLFYYF